MSKLVAFAAIQGGYKVVSTAEGAFNNALESYNADTKIEFPNTGYYLPVIYSLTGMKVEKLEDLKKPLEFARGLLPPHVKGKNHLPYLGPLLDAGMASIFAYEIIEAIRIMKDPDFYYPQEDPDLDNGKLWVGPADDIVLRKRGVEFVDGSAPGFAAIVGAAPNPEIAKMIVEDYQKKNLYIFCAANHNGTSVSQQLVEAGVQIGWNTRIVPFGPDISSAVFALGFANRAAMAFGGVQPGDYKKILMYNKDRVFAFVNALGDIGTEWGVAAAGCVNWGFPTLADTDIPEILPTGICTYEHVVANVSHDEMCQRSVEVRGLKVAVSEIGIPMSFGPAFEGERVRGADLQAQMGGGKTQATELVKMADMKEIEDGKVEIVGPDITEVEAGGTLPLGIYVQVAGREMQPDFEPILERQIHHLINYIQGIMHIGQRDIAWIRVGKGAMEKGFSLKHIGVVLHAKFHQDFGKILDKVQVTLITDKAKVDELTVRARAEYKMRDERVYQVMLPGNPDQTLVEYYLVAQDSSGMSATWPSAGTASYRVGFTAIADVQFPVAADSCASSLLEGQAVNISGVVTHIAREFSDFYFYIQQGTAPNSGMRVFVEEGFLPELGDSVIASGVVTETMCQTQVDVYAGCVSIADSGLPVSARTLGVIDDVELEENESMLVTIAGPIVIQTAMIAELHNSVIYLEFQVGSALDPVWVGTDTYEPDSVFYTTQPVPGKVLDAITGIVALRENFLVNDPGTRLRLEPRRNNDVDVNYTSSEAPPTLQTRLLPNLPNPFNPQTTITFELARASQLSLEIFDVAGARVRRLVPHRYESAGVHRVAWDGRDDQGIPLPSGVYIVKLDATGLRDSRKVHLVR